MTENTGFTGSVVAKPGDQLRMHVEKIKERRNIFVFKGQTTVDGQVVSEAEFTAMIIG